jgi:lysylphosphatidylglycerol synthetase-like protein (DUF2156 family)
MKLVVRDRIATALVAVAAIVYGLRLTGQAAWLNPSSAALLILGLGFLASASAVVPGFAALLAGSRRYLALTSLLGLAALISGLLTVVNATEETLAVLLAATVALWAAATIRHAGGLRRPFERLGPASPSVR